MLKHKNRRNFLKAAGLSMTLPLIEGLAQSNNKSQSPSGKSNSSAGGDSSSLKLTKVTPYVIRTDPPHWGGSTWFFVRLETNTGLVGWGETAILGALNGLKNSYKSLIEEAFSYYLEGENPIDREALYQKMVKGMTHQHADYVTMGLISAFDVAIWDIVGKHFNTPVYNLLGGRVRDRIRTYTYIYNTVTMGGAAEVIGDWTSRPEQVAKNAVRLVDEGFTALKFDPTPQRRDGGNTAPPWELSIAEYDHAERAVGTLRDAIGNRADILIGTHGQITPSAAKRLAARIEKYDPLWLEEPCPPRNFKEMGDIARSTSIPIATGERLVSMFEFQNIFAEGGCAFAQPDLGSCGGITACKKIATLAEANYVLMAPHVWGGPIITAAALQICANVPNFLVQESIYKSRGFFDEIVTEPFNWENGDLIVPDRPGIGTSLDEKKLEKFKV